MLPLSPPLTPLRPLQTLGYLPERGALECSATLTLTGGPEGPATSFCAGRSYPYRTIQVPARRTTAVASLTGADAAEALTEDWLGHELGIVLTDERAVPWLFVDDRLWAPDTTLGRGLRAQGRFSQLGQHFTLPHVPDLTEVFPDDYAAAQAALRQIALELDL